MSLKILTEQSIPNVTSKIAKSAFPKGNTYICLRDNLGCIFKDEDFFDLFPIQGQPALAPWRLALVTIMQFGENLSDRQAADAVRSRIDWKYLLGLELEDSGFDHSVLSEFRQRLLKSEAEERLLSLLLTKCIELGVLKAKGKQRTDSTHVLSAIRVMNRLELVGETMRAALNEIAKREPEWIKKIAREDWYKKYSHRVENSRLPSSESGKQEYAISVGQDGFILLEALESTPSLEYLLYNNKVSALRTAWNRHYQRASDTLKVIFKPNKEVVLSEEKIESPYDKDARFRTKRDINWTGYMVHLTETCDTGLNINVITHVRTTAADVHDIHATQVIQKDLYNMGIKPQEHIVDTGYLSLEQLVKSKQEYDIDLIGPVKEASTWRSKTDGAYTLDKFIIDWTKKIIHCPEGKSSSTWGNYYKNVDGYITAVFSVKDCKNCEVRDLCIGAKSSNRKVNFPMEMQYIAKKNLVERLSTAEGKALYDQRAGIEGTISQGVRNHGMRQSRYIGIKKTHLQEIASASAINIYRLVNWFNNKPLAKSRESAFYQLRPEAA